MEQVQNKSAPGTPYPGFGINGTKSLPFEGVDGNTPGAVLALPNNQLLVAIHALRPENTPAQLVRLNEDGKIDREFGFNSAVEVPLKGGASFYPSSLLALRNGGWLIIGSAIYETGEGQVRDLVVVKQDQHGKMDNTFGDDGVVQISVEGLLGAQAGKDARFVSCRDDEKTDEKFTTTPNFSVFPGSAQLDGKVVLVSTINFSPESQRGIVLRLDSNGSLDLSLAGKGYLLVNLPGFTGASNQAAGVVIEPDGNVLVCGEFDHPERIAAYVIRYDRFGAVDKTFGVSKNGLVIIADDTRLPILFAMALKPDGGIVAVGGTFGYQDVPGVGLMVVLTTDGRFNSDVNDGRPVFSDVLGYHRWHRCLLQSEGKIIVSGQGLSPVFKNTATVVARFLPNCEKDRSFADDGLVMIEDEGGYGLDQGIVHRTDDKIVWGCTSAFPTRGKVMCYFG